MLKYAIFGGTFNPIHRGHLLIAETALNQECIHQIIWVPARHPPHRTSAELIPISHRIEMVQRAIAPNPRFCISTHEADQSTPLFAVDTFNTLHATHPTAKWHWLIGLDAFRSLPRWYRRQEFLARCTWLVAPRGPQEAINMLCHQVADTLLQQAIEIEWRLLNMPSIEVSSSLIRQYCGDRRSIQDLVPDSVRLYIEEHQLYCPKS